ncbi:MAG: heavy-metal-associated domain-containing protein [Firmicutes bacterium]|nr:heavy-metal-associated domain-containing protein [Bacillota bacterium]
MSTLIIIIGVLLIAYAVYATVQKARGKSKAASCCGSKETVLAKPVADTDESHYPYKYNVSIEGMQCSNCAANVENAINASGDTWAHVNLGRRRAEVLSKSEKTEASFADLLKGTDYKVTDCTQIS